MPKHAILYVSLGLLSLTGLTSAAINYSEYFPNGSSIVQSQSDGWTTPINNSTKQIMTPEGCRIITSSQGTQMFVPTKTLGEWESFKNGAAEISVQSCAPSGIVTGLLTWSNEYLWISYPDAVSTCAALAPAGVWRVPSVSELDAGKSINAGLFTGRKFYWTSVYSDDSNTNSFGQHYALTWLPTSNIYTWCTAYRGICNGRDPNAVRCVTD